MKILKKTKNFGVFLIFFLLTNISNSQFLSKSRYPYKYQNYEFTLKVEQLGTFYISSINVDLGDSEVINYISGNDIISKKRPGTFNQKDFLIYMNNKVYNTEAKWKSVLKELTTWLEKTKKGDPEKRKFILTMRNKRSGKIIFKIKGFNSWPYRVTLRSSSHPLPSIILCLAVENTEIIFE